MILRSLRAMFRSLRWRILFGALLWSTGLFTLLEVVSRVAARTFHIGRIDSLLASLAGTFCAIAGLLIVGGGLRRLDAVRRRALELRSGESDRFDEPNLAEIEPLVRDMNELLDHRERVVRRAQATAGDLAHGLKTPLAIIAQEVSRLEQAGQHDSAAAIAEEIQRMRLQIDYHLARARASGAGITYGASVEVRPVAEKLVRTMTRLYAGKDLDIAIEIADSSAVRCEKEDLEEMLGNVIENACKWARGAVAITASRRSAEVVIAVDDDGPGIDPANRERVLQRGVRADEAAPGSGLGLAIVSEIAELYGGSVSLDTARCGGLRVHLALPSAGS
jgi:signal transduction histidine kinase